MQTEHDDLVLYRSGNNMDLGDRYSVDQFEYLDAGEHHHYLRYSGDGGQHEFSDIFEQRSRGDDHDLDERFERGRSARRRRVRDGILLRLSRRGVAQ